MTKERALKEAKKIARAQNVKMAVCYDIISNNIEEDPTGPWNYCPESARREDGKFILFPWATEIVIVKP